MRKTFRGVILIAVLAALFSGGVGIGQAPAALYYEFPLPAADSIRGSDPVRTVVQVLLLPFVGFSLLCMKIGLIPSLGLVALLGIALVAGTRRLRSTRQPRLNIEV